MNTRFPVQTCRLSTAACSRCAAGRRAGRSCMHRHRPTLFRSSAECDPSTVRRQLVTITRPSPTLGRGEGGFPFCNRRSGVQHPRGPARPLHHLTDL